MASAVNGRSYDSEFVAELEKMQREQREALLANEWKLNDWIERNEQRKAIMTAFEMTMHALSKLDETVAVASIEKILPVHR